MRVRRKRWSIASADVVDDAVGNVALAGAMVLQRCGCGEWIGVFVLEGAVGMV